MNSCASRLVVAVSLALFSVSTSSVSAEENPHTAVVSGYRERLATLQAKELKTEEDREMVERLEKTIARMTVIEARWTLGNITTRKYFEVVRIEAVGKPIEVGGRGYSAPSLYDVDDDGLLDLVVGMYGKEQWSDGIHKQGRFLIYRNAGNKKEPRYESPRFLKAGEQIAAVPVG